MGSEIRWHTQDSIVLVRIWGDMEIQDFPEYDRQILQHIEQSPHALVHIWVDLRGVAKFPANVPQIHRALTHLNHPRTGWSVLITENRVIRFVGYMITQLVKARFRAVSTEEEALTFLQQVDTTLTTGQAAS